MPWADGDLKPFLARSLGLHACGAGAFLLLFPRVASLPKQVYRIDFIGPAAGIVNRSPAAQAPPAPEAPPQPKAAAQPGRHAAPPLVDQDAFPKSPRRPLPRPSVLSDLPPEPSPPEEAPKAAAPRPRAPEAAAGSRLPPGPAAADPEAGASVETDMPNFPYPWYIAQVRTALWHQWSSRMPAGGGEATVMFSLLRNGSAVDIRVEASSGDAGFDVMALSAVKEAGPFPPMPPGFRERFLRIHVRLRSL